MSKRYCSLFSKVFAGVAPCVGASQASAQLSPDAVRADALTRTDSLKTIKAPDAPNHSTFVRNRLALRILGKALFWDQQVGSDGQACASCHFHAGADNRSKNQLNPGFRNQTPQFPNGDTTFGNSPLAGVPTPTQFGPNYQLQVNDFPFHKLFDVNNQASPVLADTNDV